MEEQLVDIERLDALFSDARFFQLDLFNEVEQIIPRLSDEQWGMLVKIGLSRGYSWWNHLMTSKYIPASFGATFAAFRHSNDIERCRIGIMGLRTRDAEGNLLGRSTDIPEIMALNVSHPDLLTEINRTLDAITNWPSCYKEDNVNESE